MEIMDCIIGRRSIRKFRMQQVPDDLTEQLLKAAMYAPSARNTQSWQFIVVQQRETLNAIMQVHPYAGMLATATLAILVCGDKKLEPSEAYLNQNCSAATQNILLAAHGLGLGSVWLGVYPRRERAESMSKLFCLPDHIVPISLVAVGYPDENLPSPERYTPLNIHHEKW